MRNVLHIFRSRDKRTLRKISIPVQYLYVLLAGRDRALCLTESQLYTRMLAKVAHYNQLRTEQPS